MQVEVASAQAVNRDLCTFDREHCFSKTSAILGVLAIDNEREEILLRELALGYTFMQYTAHELEEFGAHLPSIDVRHLI